MRGVIYHGRSLLTHNADIVGIVTESANSKTGDMLQLWTLDATANPLSAVQSGADRSVCGDCLHRGKSCYVRVEQAPLAVWRAWQRGTYPTITPSDIADRPIRLGAYGEPVALPLALIEAICQSASSWTGYTHQWRNARAQPYRQYLMASCDSEQDRQDAKALGWRTFRVKSPSSPKLASEIVCPASSEAGHKLTCDYCTLCSGQSRRGRDIVINAHGSAAKVAAFKRISLV